MEGKANPDAPAIDGKGVEEEMPRSPVVGLGMQDEMRSVAARLVRMRRERKLRQACGRAVTLAGTLETLLLVATRKADLRARCIGAVCELSVHASSHGGLMHHGLLPLLAAYARAVDSTLRYECVQAAYNLTVVANGGAVPLKEDDDMIISAAAGHGDGDGGGKSSSAALGGISYGVLLLPAGSSREEQVVVAGVASALTIGSLFRSDDPLIMDLSCLALLNLAYCGRARRRLLDEGVLWAIVKLGADGRAEAERSQEDEAEVRVMAVARSRNASASGDSPGSDFIGIRSPSTASGDSPDDLAQGSVGDSSDFGSPANGESKRMKRAQSLLMSPHGIISRRRSVRAMRGAGTPGSTPSGKVKASRQSSPLRKSSTTHELIEERNSPTDDLDNHHAFDFASLDADRGISPLPTSEAELAAIRVTGETTTAAEALHELASDPFARTSDRQLTCTRFLRALAASGAVERKQLSDKRTIDALVAFATSPHPLVRVDAGIIVAELVRDEAVAGLAVRRGAVAAVWELMLQPDLPCATRAAAALLRMCCHAGVAKLIATTGNTAVPLLTSFFSYADRLLRRGADHGTLARSESGQVSTPVAAHRSNAPQPL